MNLSSFLVKRAINLPITSRIAAGLISPFPSTFSTDKPNDFKLIKRPNTPYLIYVNEKRKAFVEQNKNAKATEIVSKLAEQWRKLDLNDKKVYYEKYDEEAKKYKEALSKMPKNELDEYNIKKHEYLVSRRKHLARFREKKERKVLKEPKKPSGSFGLYIQSLDRGNGPATEFIKGAAEKWKKLPEEEKEKYRKEYKEKAAAFEKEKLAWESEMVLKGKERLIRKSTWGNLSKSVKKAEAKKASGKKSLKKKAATVTATKKKKAPTATVTRKKKATPKSKTTSKAEVSESESDSDKDEKAKDVFK